MTFGDRFYSVAELADVTGYHRDTIYRAIDGGELVASKPRGKWLIAGDAINAWLQAGRPAVDHSAEYSRPPAPAPARSEKPARRSGPGARGSFRERARKARAVTG